MVLQIAKEAFKEFCTNTEFGIESYLGRRIRHNTLHGVMTDPIDGVIQKPVYRPIIAGTKFGDALRVWEGYYKSYIERMREEFLQFTDSTKPNALFNPTMNMEDPTAQRDVAQLSQALKMSGPEMLPDLIISFCWRQIGPQLEYASRQIKVKMVRDVKQSLEQTLGKYQGPQEQNIFSEINEAIEMVFSKVASWFRRPDTGFVAATMGDICNIIDIECGRQDSPTIVTGNALNTECYGISVHRLYDCLAVLIQNAIKHGALGKNINVNCLTKEIPGTNLHNVSVEVVSWMDTEGIERSVKRIKDAISSTETGKDMVTEGYSGLKKLKYITKLNEGHHTVEVTHVGDELELRFCLKAETANGGIENEENSVD